MSRAQHAPHGVPQPNRLLMEPLLPADPLYAREKVWLPFMKEQLKCGPDTIIVVSLAHAAAAPCNRSSASTVTAPVVQPHLSPWQLSCSCGAHCMCRRRSRLILCVTPCHYGCVQGHSSGAAAAMRFAEGDKVAGILLVSAYSRCACVEPEVLQYGSR